MTWTVAAVMTGEPVTVAPATPFKTCVNVMRIHELTALPVVLPDGTLAGIVSEADMLAKEAQLPLRGQRRAAGRARAMTAGELMTTGTVTTTPRTPLPAAASLMFEHHLKVLPVVDSKNRLVGIISRSQVLKVFLRSDESIRREVARDLLNEPQGRRGDVEVDVKDGVVHLYGDLEMASLSDLIQRLVAGVPGVVGVVNHPSLAAEPMAAGVGQGANDHA